MAGQALQQKTTDKGGENSQLQDIQGQEGHWNISAKVQGTAVHHGAEAKSCEGHCVNMCGAAQHAEKLSGGADRPPTPADDIQPPKADQTEQGQNENFRNPSREAKINETY